MKALYSCMLFLSMMMLFSCGEQPYFMDTYKFENEKWIEGTAPVFNVDFNGDSTSYDVIFTFRTSTNYEFNKFNRQN